MLPDIETQEQWLARNAPDSKPISLARAAVAVIGLPAGTLTAAEVAAYLGHAGVLMFINSVLAAVSREAGMGMAVPGLSTISLLSFPGLG